MACRWSPLGVHVRRDIRLPGEPRGGEFAGDEDFSGLEAGKGVFDNLYRLGGVFGGVAKCAELAAFGEDVFASHGVNNEGDDDADPGVKG